MLKKAGGYFNMIATFVFKHIIYTAAVGSSPSIPDMKFAYSKVIRNGLRSSQVHVPTGNNFMFAQST